MKERRNRGDIGENYFPNAVLRQAEIGQKIPKNPPAPGIHQSSLCRRARPKGGRGLGGENVEILNFPTLPFPIRRLKEHEMLVPRREGTERGVRNLLNFSSLYLPYEFSSGRPLIVVAEKSTKSDTQV